MKILFLTLSFLLSFNLYSQAQLGPDADVECPAPDDSQRVPGDNTSNGGGEAQTEENGDGSGQNVSG